MLSVLSVILGTLSLTVFPTNSASAFTTNSNAIQIEYTTAGGTNTQLTMGLIGPQNLQYALTTGDPVDADFVSITNTTAGSLRQILPVAPLANTTYLLTIRAIPGQVGDLYGLSGYNSTTALNRVSTLTSNRFITSIISLGNFPHLSSLHYLLSQTRLGLTVPATLPSSVTDLSYLFFWEEPSNEKATSLPDLSHWDTSNVTRMRGTFQGHATYNLSLSAWDVSRVTDMTTMFYGATAFNNGDPSGATTNVDMAWSTPALTSAYGMFYGASNFNQNLDSWDVSKITSLGTTFMYASKFNNGQAAGVGGTFWSTSPRGIGSSLLNMQETFSNATAFNQDISAWNTVNVTDLYGSFNYATVFNNGAAPGVSTVWNWNTSKVTRLSLTFNWAEAFNADISQWDTSSVTNLGYTFYKASRFNQNISSWNTSLVTSMQATFGNATAFNQPLNSWDTSRVTTMSSMFTGADAFNQPLNNWNTSAVTTMASMFQGTAVFNGSLANWNTSAVTTMASMFSSAQLFNQPLSHFDTRNVTTMASMFNSARAFAQDVSGWDTGKVTSFANMFASAAYFNQNLGSWRLSSATTLSGMFSQSNGAYNISQTNLENTYIEWAQQSLPSNLDFSGAFTKLHYSNCLSKQAFNFLDVSAASGGKNWTMWTNYGTLPTLSCTTNVTVDWGTPNKAGSVTNTSPTSSTTTFTPNLKATSNAGTPAIRYTVFTQGTTGCKVDRLTGVITYTTAGTCVVKAWDANTSSTMTAASVTFNLPTPGAVGAATAPSTPTLSLSSSNLLLSFSAPSSNGGSSISDYKYRSTTDNGVTWSNWVSAGTTSSPITISGLSGSNSPKYQLLAVTSAGDGIVSETSLSIPLATPPGAPTLNSATGGNGSIILDVTAPSSTGTSAITSYEYSTDGGTTWTDTSSISTTITATGLTNGTSYSVAVRAKSSAGAGASSTVLTATPFTVPGAPTSVVATAGAGQASVAFNAPSNGGSAITNYQVLYADASNQLVWTTYTPSPGVTTSPIVVTGLTNGTSYVFKVVASNAAGTGLASTVSSAVTPVTVPGAPSGLLVVPGSGQASLSFTGSASNGGSAITGYEYRYTWNSGANASTPVSLSSSTRSVTITGLTNGVAYNFEVRAVNALGNSSWASTAQSTTPSGVPGEVVTSDAVVGNGTLTFDYALSSDGGSPVTDYQYRYSYNPRGVGIYTNFTSWISMNTTSDSTNLVMSNLHNGDAYVVQIRAVNANGYSTYRGNVNNWASGTPVTFPNAPTINTVTTDNGKITLGLTPPTDDGGSSIVHYMYQLSNDGGTSWSNPSTAFPTNNSVTILGVGNNTTYKVRVCANNGSTNTVGSCETHNTYSNVVDAVMPVAAVLVLTNVPGGAVYNQPLTTQPRIQLYNSSNQLLAVGGVEVTATIHTGTGSVVNATATTDSTGLAIFSNLKIVGTPAVNGFKLKFSITNLSTPATTGFFTLAKGPQAAVTMTNATSGFPGDQITLSAAGGSGSGAISYARTGSSTCTVSSANNVWTVTLGDAGSTCTVTATRASDVYYLAETSSAATITVAQRSQTLSFTSTIPSSPVSGGTYTPVAVSSESLTPTLSVTTNSVCSLSNGVVNFLTSGTCTIRATQAGNNNVLAATAVEQDIVVGMKNQNITFPAISDRSYGAAAFFAGATVDSDLPLAYTSTDTSVCTVGASTGMIQVKTSGTLTNTTCTITVSQASGDNRYAPANSVSRSFEVSAIVPTAPYLRAVSMGNAQATVSFTAPQSNGGADIQYYSVVATSATAPTVATYDCVATPLASPPGCTILGLLNGSEYSFQVFALNTAGTGAASNVSATYIPATNPDAVTGLATVPGNTTLAISWAQPESLGGGAFTSYQVFIRERGTAFSATPTAIVGAAAGSNPADVTATSYTATGLTNGTTYDVKVVVITTANTTAMESNTTIAWGIPATVPSAVNGLTVRALGETSAFASWTVPTSDGGSLITSYAVTTSAGTCAAVQGSTTSCLITGLTPGSQLSVSVKAVNDRGQSVAADASTTLPGTTFVPSTPTVSNSNTSTIGVAPYRATEVSAAAIARQTFSNVPTPGNGYEAPRSGEAVVLVNGAAVTPIIVINDGAAEITVPGSVSLTMWAQGTDGEKSTVEDGTQLVIAQGSDLVLSGSGFQPASPTEAWLFSDATLLGSGLATAKGTVSGKYGVASSAMLGDRTIQFNGVAADGSVVSVAVGVTIIAAAEDSPEAIAQNRAVTQQNFTVFIVLGISAATFLLFLAFYLRRRKQSQD
jgi:surface protein